MKKNDDDDVIDLSVFFQRLQAGWYWIAIFTISLAALAGAVTFLMTPIYRGTIVLAPATNDSGPLGGATASALSALGGFAGLAGLSVGAGSQTIEEGIAVLRSRSFTEKFITDLDLMPVMFRDDWDSSGRRWKGGPDDAPTPAQGYKFFDESIRSISRDKKTGLITVNIDWYNPNDASRLANELVSRLNTEMRERAIKSADASIVFLEKEIPKTTLVDTRDNLNRLLEAQINRKMFATVTEEFAFRVIDEALPPDPDDVYSPRLVLYILGGGVAGLLLGSLFATGRAEGASARRSS